ncbi:hypothetical protein [Roseicella aerolata]|uniref:HIRAN domain-containing protein n=1 Tax=Roseicella aerolata TaxID=2883479 RepID=A0A9X1IL52_9PROT|nr:hypothetical protein [Roseicella aerolata]MCB4825403.1 hypothetical protein [Roseicella aerolata]
MIDTYLLGAGGLERDPSLAPWLRAGTRLDLWRDGQSLTSGTVSRSPRPSRLEIRTRDGQLLGRLPPDEAQEVSDFMDAGASATVWVRGVVPAFRRPRVQLVIELGAAA